MILNFTKNKRSDSMIGIIKKKIIPKKKKLYAMQLYQRYGLLVIIINNNKKKIWDPSFVFFPELS